jgi:ribosomal protein S18 acetylase RimI-like enzyme
MTKIRNAQLTDIPVIRDLAEKTWWPVYSPIVEKEQIAYMLAAIYSEEALAKVMNAGTQQFILLEEDAVFQGFAAYGARPEDASVYKLHKLYVLPQTHGKGYGKMLIDEIKTRLATLGVKTLDLNVNRANKAIGFYERMGFHIVKEEDVAIGPYWMTDYVMRMDL